MKSIFALAAVCVIALAQIAFAVNDVNWSNLVEKFANKTQGTALMNTAQCIRIGLQDNSNFDVSLAQLAIEQCAPSNRYVLFIYLLLVLK